ncbi:tyrosine phosphatase family-domain-containing protein [Podospora didyma]|uniref:diphosphoinositol-polyphosphate diphosphatase n=1 Tax=Podospora didyma TaxID=330526 RepID=A0AAE0U0W9_9PEZI|nr:tyrosine phosphatase family-domain-containing protein [Podospora didyma]
MAVDGKVVSKRSARTYAEDDMEKGPIEYHSKRSSRYEDMVPDAAARKNSTSTSTSQSSQTSRHTSLEVSSLVPSAGVEQAVVVLDSENIGQLEEQGLCLETPKSLERFDAAKKTIHSSSCSSHSSDELDELPVDGRPINFGVVVPGVYRSSFPKAEDHAFIEGLNLKTIVSLVQKDSPQGYVSFIRKNGIKHHVFDMKGTKKEDIPIKTMKSILRLVLDRQNHPILIHCNHGKHRTGCVVGVVRKVSGWDVSTIIDEYKEYAAPKIRECDVNYITNFELADISNLFVRESIASITLPLRPTRSFLRVTLFSVFVLVIWLFSGNKIAITAGDIAAQRKLLK